ncbi:MAG: hypothetical protein SOW77_07305 [Ruminococcus sp.]|nr:hypothetical protein [Ruminococcus sp.]
MVKGFIFFKSGKIPFVIENYQMELFTDDELLNDFMKEYNFKMNYILNGICLDFGVYGQKATFLVNNTMGCTCYLSCYIINMLDKDEEYDTIGFQSPFLDDIFKYKYNYLETIRSGVNLAVAPKDIYIIPFFMDDKKYELTFRMGQDNRLGLLEDYDRKGEILLPIQTNDIHECFNLSVVLNRLAMFMHSRADIPFKQITLYNKGIKAGWFYCPFISDVPTYSRDEFFHNLDVMKYIPKILSNIASDSGNKITKSIPLGHLADNDSMFSPQRFMEQIMAFEYLFDKLEHKKAQDSRFPLKRELEYMFDEFPQLLSNTKLTSDKISEQIKEIRRTIAHGHAYYYDFKNDPNTRYLIILLDKLIKDMSLKWIGFSEEDIQNYII